MTALHEQGALKQEFRATLTLGEFLGEAKAVLAPSQTEPDAQVKEGLARGVQVLMDNGDAQQLGAGLRGVDSVTASKMNDERRKQKEKKDREARRLQALLDELAAIDAEIVKLEGQIDELNERIEAVDSLIDGLEDGSVSVEEALQHPEMIEALRKSGKTIDPDDPNAKEILVGILAGHGASLTNERDGLKERVDGLNRRREHIVDSVKDIDSDLGLSIEQKRASAASISDKGYGEADVVAEVAVTQEVVADASIFRVGSRDQDVVSDQDTERSSHALDDLFAGDSALDFASADLGKQFSTVSPPETDNQIALTNTSDLKLENGMT